MLHGLCRSYEGTLTTKWTQQQTMNSPKMTETIKQLIEWYKMCQEQRSSNRKPQLLPPSNPRLTVEQNILFWQFCLLLGDYTSKFPVVLHLPSSQHILSPRKYFLPGVTSHCSYHVSYHVPFASREVSHSARSIGIIYILWRKIFSPGYSQSNGMAEWTK